MSIKLTDEQVINLIDCVTNNLTQTPIARDNMKKLLYLSDIDLARFLVRNKLLDSLTSIKVPNPDGSMDTISVPTTVSEKKLPHSIVLYEAKVKQNSELYADLSDLLQGISIHNHDAPQFWCKEAGWACDPQSMSVGSFSRFWSLLYFMGDVKIIENFMQLCLGNQYFYYDGNIYKTPGRSEICVAAAIGEKFAGVWSSDTNLNAYLLMVPAYCAEYKKSIEKYDELAHQAHEAAAKTFLARYKPCVYIFDC